MQDHAERHGSRREATTAAQSATHATTAAIATVTEQSPHAESKPAAAQDYNSPGPV